MLSHEHSQLHTPSLRCNDQARHPVCIRTSDPQFSLTDQGWGLSFTDRVVGEGPLGPHPNLCVPYLPSAQDLSCFGRGAAMEGSRTSWPFHSPQSVSLPHDSLETQGPESAYLRLRQPRTWSQRMRVFATLSVRSSVPHEVPEGFKGQ